MKRFAATTLLILFVAAALAPFGGALAQAPAPQAESDPEANRLLRRLKDENVKAVYSDAMLTLTHDYQDHRRLEQVINFIQSYSDALAKHEQGDSSALKALGGMGNFDNEMVAWLNDPDQAIRAFAAAMLGVIGNRVFSPQVAKLLTRKDHRFDKVIYDRGQAALALGMLQATQYLKDILALLSSKNEYDRAGAVGALGWMGTREHAGVVAPFLKDKDETVRKTAKRALQMISIQSELENKN